MLLEIWEARYPVAWCLIPSADGDEVSPVPSVPWYTQRSPSSEWTMGRTTPTRCLRRIWATVRSEANAQGRVQHVCVLGTLLRMNMKETTWVEKNQFKYKDGKYNESFTDESKVFAATQMVLTPKVWTCCENSKHLSMQQGSEGRKGLSCCKEGLHFAM